MAGKRVRFSDAVSTEPIATTYTPTSAPITQLALNPENPRENYDDVDELADSLRESGQLQALTVVDRDLFLAHYPRHAATLDDTRWVVITGNRRLAAARRAGITELLITVQDRLGASGDQRLRESVIIENIHRQALPPLLEAKELQALVTRHGTQAQVAKRIAKTQGWVSQRLALLKLIPQLQDQLRSGGMTVEEARAVAGKPASKQSPALELLRRNSPTATPDSASDAKPLLRRNNRRHSAVGGAHSRETGHTISVRIDQVEHTAGDLRTHLTAEQLQALGELLRH